MREMANTRKDNPFEQQKIIVKTPNKDRKHLAMYERVVKNIFVHSPQVARIIDDQKNPGIKSFFKSVWSKIQGK